MTLIAEYRTGRNFIRVGDGVRVKPSRPHKHDGGPAKVIAIRAADDDRTRIIGVDVVLERSPGVRTFLPERIERVAQTRVPS